MDAETILFNSHALIARLSELGFLQPEVSGHVNFYYGETFSVRVEMRLTESFGSVLCEHFHGEDFNALFLRARAWIESQKTPDELRKEKFIAQLGRVIDEGKEIGFDVDFMNPLVETMKRLSENVLEFRAA